MMTFDVAPMRPGDLIPAKRTLAGSSPIPRLNPSLRIQRSISSLKSPYGESFGDQRSPDPGGESRFQESGRCIRLQTINQPHQLEKLSPGLLSHHPRHSQSLSLDLKISIFVYISERSEFKDRWPNQSGFVS